MDARHPSPGGLPLASVACACAAAALSDTLAHPLSTVKARLQVQGIGGGLQGVATYRGIAHAFWSVARSEGPVRLYAGFGAALLSSAPGQGLYFGAYELARGAMGAEQSSSSSAHFAAGAFAQLCSSLVCVPADVVKQRLQVQGQVEGAALLSGSFGAPSAILRQEGLRGLYRGFGAHLATWLPFNALYFLIYEKGKAFCINAGYEDGHDNLEPTALLCCGASAGAIAAILTNPLDVLKTRAQVAQVSPAALPQGAWHVARCLLRHEGASAFMTGALARAAHLTARATICVTAYEHIKVYCS